MKILIISDKVTRLLYENFDKTKFKDISFVISCGDLPTYYLNFIIDALNVPCFYVPGNHDREFSENPPLGWVSLHNKIVVHEGLKMMGLGGSPFYNGESEFQYTESQMAFKLFKLRSKLWWRDPIDIFVTHTPAKDLGDIKDSHTHGGFQCFHKVLDIHKPKLFTYGHVHITYGGIRGLEHNNTVLVNAYDHQIINWDKMLKKNDS